MPEPEQDGSSNIPMTLLYLFEGRRRRRRGKKV
jgi:hypothetical protein